MTALLLLVLGLAVFGCMAYVIALLLGERAVGEDATDDAETVTWLQALADPDAEFDAWCAQAIALTREPEDADLTLWEHELADGAR